MTESNDPTPVSPESSTVPPPFGEATPAPAAPAAPAYAGPSHAAPAAGPIGQVRSTGTCILLSIVTLGIYGWFWYYKTHEEMKQHTGEGIGGAVALILAIFVSIVMPFLSSNEVGKLYERRGQKAPVTAMTGLWFLLLGWFFLVGAIVWFVKTNNALNEYWKSQGAPA
ncbi:DUF4234 domain-containing protein [Nocardioides sp. T2.26MG-1]|uniref:DUF4234 domain-containing protein n=1 Tax=Nocardioides sp. T2.26MG-1 TaxID=3041166 RepID=UPI0024777F91|nr:DUF4234 domain-containing protein [Nocardioides sp. T2.26MG-1]CAI9415930.1 hypothetical protein HIDPHFAB_02648 [Nocardioides sp. T2.26MG-1]